MIFEPVAMKAGAAIAGDRCAQDRTDFRSWDSAIRDDGLSLLLGEGIAGGQDRIVYAAAFDRELIVKVELGTHRRQNYSEWLVWRTVREAVETQKGDIRRRFLRVQRWLCPIWHLSPGGTFLLMRRTTPIGDKLPRLVPAFMTDLKAENFGLLEGRPVCHDYGTLARALVIDRLAGGGSDLRMRKAKW